MVSFGILTVSDTCYDGTKKDTSGPRLKEEVEKAFPDSSVLLTAIVRDELKDIKDVLVRWSDSEKCNVILTTGGTGFAERDVTPEATRQVIQKEAPGLAFAMISKSLAITEMAMLSRAVCGIRSKTLIVNLPGSEKGAAECFGFIKNTLPHAVALLSDKKEEIITVHNTVQKCGEPKEKRPDDDVGFSPSKVTLDNVASRNRKSPYPMLEVSEAVDIIFKECSPTLETEVLPFEKSVNRILAEDVYADEPIPSFRASMKDGYAVRANGGSGTRIVRDVAAAGDEPFAEDLKRGETIRISTGAPVPPGADAVVQVEDTTIVETSADKKKEVVIRIHVTPRAGQDIRDIGSDVAAGSLVLKKFDRISPASVGVLAMLGKTEVLVFKRESIGILSTGNEVKNPRDKLKPGQIRDSNKFTLMSLLSRYSYESVDCGTVKDDPTSVKVALQKAFSKNDVIITSGGVSMGEFDVLKRVLVEDFGATIHFGRVNMKPGKPTTFATLIYDGRMKKIFGLPGNPVSCSVTSLLFVIPALRFLERSITYRFPVIKAMVSGSSNGDARPEYHRVQVTVDKNTGQSVGVSTGNQISSRLNSLVGANGLALLYPHTSTKDGILCDVLIFDELLYTDNVDNVLFE